MGSARVLLVDFNNFSRYPTTSIGYLTAVLRRAGHEVSVFSPFAVGIKGVVREPPESRWSLFAQQARYWTSTLEAPAFRALRSQLAFVAASQLARSRRRVAEDFRIALERGVDVVLVSTYLLYSPHCAELARQCAARGIPLLVGSQSFVFRETVGEWLKIPGVTALVGGEVEHELPEIVAAALAGRDLLRFPGLWTRSGGGPAPPLKDLDSVPFPDYDDFPWDAYPNRIVPMVTGRGCGWGKCTFCSDIVSGAGRTYRSRSPENVIAELEHQSGRYHSNLFVFTDLKLNSNERVWDTLLDQLGPRVPDARWIADVHVDPTDDTLHGKQLARASRAGCVRLTTGLESGSQRVLDDLRKGTDLRRTSRFLREARAEGISVRTTMIIGAPGEEACDVDDTRRFLEDHEGCIERVRLNRLSIMVGTGLYKNVQKEMGAFPAFYGVANDHAHAALTHLNARNRRRDYRRSIRKLITTVHSINRTPLRERARDFEGVM